MDSAGSLLLRTGVQSNANWLMESHSLFTELPARCSVPGCSHSRSMTSIPSHTGCLCRSMRDCVCSRLVLPAAGNVSVAEESQVGCVHNVSAPFRHSCALCQDRPRLRNRTNRIPLSASNWFRLFLVGQVLLVLLYIFLATVAFFMPGWLEANHGRCSHNGLWLQCFCFSCIFLAGALMNYKEFFHIPIM